MVRAMLTALCFATSAVAASGDVSAAMEGFRALSPAERDEFLKQLQLQSPTSSQPGPVHSGLCSSLCAPVCETEVTDACMSNCNQRCSASQAAKPLRPGALSPWIKDTNAIQHLGLTTSDLYRSIAFYTKVMGGVEVVGNGGDGWDGDDVYNLLMQAALVRGGAASDFAADLSAGGADTMSARYVQFDSVVIELLDYHSKEAELQRLIKANDADTFPRTAAHVAASLQSARSFPTFSDSTVAPSVAGNMHISFNVRPELDLNEFVTALEETAHRSGFTEVYCNRVVPVARSEDGHPDVAGISEENNSYAVIDGDFQGWNLAYCKGPDGEQLEFNQVTGKAKENFDQALRTYFSGGENGIWL